MKKYFEEIDISKGIAILLVILGHSFSTAPINLFEQLTIFGDIVRSFQMQLFFFVSGFLFYINQNLKDFLIKKSQRLLIPYLAFSIITIILKLFFNNFTHSEKVNINILLPGLIYGGFYWYLYVLFGYMIFTKLFKNLYIISFISLVTIIIWIIFPLKDILYITSWRAIYFYPFFVLGFIVKPYYEKFSFPFGNIWLLFALIILYFMNFLIRENKIIESYIIPLIGILFVLGLSVRIMEFNSTRDNNNFPKIKNVKSVGIFKKFFKFMGKYSLQFYLNHLLIISPCYFLPFLLNINSPLPSLFIVFFTAIILSYFMLLIEKRFIFTRMISGLPFNRNS